jgi:hypothetical protein
MIAFTVSGSGGWTRPPWGGPGNQRPPGYWNGRTLMARSLEPAVTGKGWARVARVPGPDRQPALGARAQFIDRFVLAEVEE